MWVRILTVHVREPDILNAPECDNGALIHIAMVAMTLHMAANAGTWRMVPPRSVRPESQRPGVPVPER